MDYYNAPGAAAFDALQEQIARQAALKHQALLDSITVQREGRLAESDRLDHELKRESLGSLKEERESRRKLSEQTQAEKTREKEVGEFTKERDQMIPGDVPTPEMIAKGKRLGIALQLSPQQATTRPDVSQPVGATDATVPATLSQSGNAEPVVPEQPVPLGVVTPYAGNKEQRQQEIDRRQIQAMVEDPNTRPAVREYLKARMLLPKGENPPTDPKFYTDAEDKGVNNQIHTVLYKGKPVDANYDPKTRKVTYRGVDITEEAGHYEKPAAVGFIQSGNGYLTKDEVARRLRDGQDVPLATTSSTRTMEEGAKMLVPHIKRLEQVGEELDKRKLFGPVMSRVRELLTKVGTLDEFQSAIAKDPELNNDRLVGQFAASLGLMATGAGRVHGGARGGGSVQMLNHFKSLLSDASTFNMFVGRLDSLDEYMQGYAAGPGGEVHAPTAPKGSGKVIRYDMNGNVIP